MRKEEEEEIENERIKQKNTKEMSIFEKFIQPKSLCCCCLCTSHLTDTHR
jgi:hypothetical protein